MCYYKNLALEKKNVGLVSEGKMLQAVVSLIGKNIPLTRFILPSKFKIMVKTLNNRHM